MLLRWLLPVMPAVMPLALASPASAEPAGNSVTLAQRSGPAPVANNCRRVCSSHGARTRCDGSVRSPRFPIHNGIDIAVAEGTPLVAVADGTVVQSGAGPSIGGIAIVLAHPPEATGSQSYAFTVYKHLYQRSHLPVGARVRKGEVVAVSGRTGTVGGYYGPAGFPHLHFEAHVSATSRWPSGSPIDPMEFLRRTGGWPLSCR